MTGKNNKPTQNKNKQKQNKNQQKKKNTQKQKPKQNQNRAPNKQVSRRLNNNSVSITSVNEGVGFTIKPFKQENHVIEGCDYLYTVQLPNALSTSQYITDFAINPLTMLGTSRLARFAALYDLFSVEHLSFHYATSVGTQTPGTLLMAWDADPTDDYREASGDSLLTDLNSCPSNTNFSVYRNSSMNVPRSNKQFFVQAEEGGDQRLVNYGRLWLVSEGGLASGTYGRILIKWKFKFYRPASDPDTATVNYAASSLASGGNVSDTYPWGNFSALSIGAGFSATYDPGVVIFQSTIPGSATAASVLVFKLPGQYRVTINVTGTAIGSGSFTPSSAGGVLYGGTGPNAASFPFTGQGIGHTSTTTTVTGWFDVKCTISGGWVACTGASGTHSIAGVTVMRFPNYNIPPPPGPAAQSRLEANEVQELRKMLQEMRNLSVNPKATKPPPMVAKPFAPFSTDGNLDTAGQIQTIQSPAGEPVEQYATTLNGTLNAGIVDVVVVDPVTLDESLRHLFRERPPGDVKRAIKRMHAEFTDDTLANFPDRTLNKIFERVLLEPWYKPRSPV